MSLLGRRVARFSFIIIVIRLYDRAQHDFRFHDRSSFGGTDDRVRR